MGFNSGFKGLNIYAVKKLVSFGPEKGASRLLRNISIY